MADVRANRKLDRGRIEFPGGSRAANPAGIFLARMFGDDLALGHRAIWKEIADALGKFNDVALVLLGTMLRCFLANAPAFGGIGLAFTLRAFERCTLDQHALTLIPSSTPAEPDDDRVLLRMLGSPARERRVSAGQEHEMIDPETNGADDAALLHSEEGPLLALDPARPASRSVSELEYDDVLGGIVSSRGISASVVHARPMIVTSPSGPSPSCRHRRKDSRRSRTMNRRLPETKWPSRPPRDGRRGAACSSPAGSGRTHRARPASRSCSARSR